MSKIKVFLGGYVNTTNAQNLNCLALAKHLDKEKFEVYTLKLYSGNLKDPSIKGVHLFKCFYPHKLSKYLGYLWGIYKCDIAFLPKGEINAWNQFWLKLLNRKSFSTVEGILDEKNMASRIMSAGSYSKVVKSFKVFDRLFSITKFLGIYQPPFAPSAPAQRRLQGPPAKSNFLAVIKSREVGKQSLMPGGG